MTRKTLFLPLGLLATTLSLTGCATVSSVPAASLYPPSGVLHLQQGQTYRATGVETWHSAARYQALELQLIDAVSAMKHLQNQ
jgi:hypothetical protein